MAKVQPISLRFPVGGVVRRHAIQTQAPFTTIDAMNVWPTDWTTGRERGGTRPGLTSTSGISGLPYNGIEATWYSGNPATTYRGVAVSHSGGVSIYNGTGWSSIFSSATASFSSCAIYQNHMYHAVGGSGSIKRYNLDTSGTPSSGTLGGDVTAYNTAQKLLDPTWTDWTQPPTNCGIVVTHQDRLWFAGDTSNPHVIYACAVGNALDWRYAEVTRNSAYVSSGPQGGMISEPIVALTPHGSECLLVHCLDSFYIVRGNPTAGGYMTQLNAQVGALMQSAWCKDEKNRTWFVSRRGLHVVPEGCGAPPEAVSSNVIPDELVGIDPASGAWVSVGYDLRWKGLHIYVVDSVNGNKYWFYDMQSGGFWPMEVSVTLQLALPIKSKMTPDKSAIHAFTTSGSAYQFDRTNTSESIDSYVYYGPVQLGGPMDKGGVLSISATLDAPNQTSGEDLDSTEGRVAWELRVGDSAQQAYNAMPAAADEWGINGWNYPSYPRRSGNAAYVKLTDVAGKRWSVEEVVLERLPAGMRRVG